MTTLRTYLTTSLTLLAVLASAATTLAADATVGFNIGYAKPVSEDFDEDFGGDLAYTGYATFPLAGALSLRGEVGRVSLDLQDELNDLCGDFNLSCDGNLSFTSFSAGIQYGGAGGGLLPLDEARILPYFFALAGLYKTKGELAVETFSTFVEQDETYFGVAVGGGLNIRLGERWGLQGDLHVHAIKIDEAADVRIGDWVYLVEPSAGVWISF